MSTITIGYVSGFIAIAVFLVQFIFPTLLALILSAWLGPKNNAVTWSVAGRTLQSSHWPTILQTDSAASTGVSKRVVFLTWLKTLVMVLIAIAGIIAPLGLYDDVVQDGNKKLEFQYARDPGPFGFATPNRSELGLTRRCGSLLPKPCPGSKVPFTQTGNNTKGSVSFPEGYDGRLPRDRYHYFASGLDRLSDTISGIWDIDWRSYSFKEDRNQEIPMNNGSRYAVGEYRTFQNIVLDDEPLAIEGLVVDPSLNGIGFRNHTLPKDARAGAAWSEDLLFVSPETACVPNNISLEFTIGDTNDTTKDISDLRIVDQGGFVEIDRTYVPWMNATLAQNDLNLRGRAYMAAFINNANLMFWYNISNPKLNASVALGPKEERFEYLHSEIGKSFTVGVDSLTPVAADLFRSTPHFSDFMQLESSDALNSSTLSPNHGANPFNVSKDFFDEIPDWCAWFSSYNPGNISTVAVGCSMIYATAQPISQGIDTSFYAFELGSRWSVPLYSCATAVKASIKTVDLESKGTDLKGLTVQSIKDKAFESVTSKPLWPVESTDMKLSDGVPLWGLVNASETPPPNITTLQRDYLYLPGNVNWINSGSMAVENMPGIDFHILALSVASNIAAESIGKYGTDNGVPTIGQNFPIQDLSRKTNVAMLQKWRDLSKDSDGVAKILNRVWTDAAANSVVGTKGLMGSRSQRVTELAKRSINPPTDNSQEVTTYARKVQYRWPFAIPAFIVLLSLLVTGVFACVICVIENSGISSVNEALNQTSTGRIMTKMLYPEDSSPNLKAKQWIKSLGRREIDYSTHYPLALEQNVQDESLNGELESDEHSSLADQEQDDEQVQQNMPSQDGVKQREDEKAQQTVQTRHVAKER